MQSPELPPPRPVSNRQMLLLMAAFALAFVVAGLALDAPRDIAQGMQRILSSRDTLITDYMGQGGIGAALVQAGLLTLAALAVYWRFGRGHRRRGGGLPVAGAGLRPVRQEPAQRLGHRGRRVAVRALQGRALRQAHQHRLLRHGAGADLQRDPVQQCAGAAHQPAAGRGHDRAARLRAGARGGAPVPRAPGAFALQHGFRRRTAGHADGGGLQELRFRARPGVHLDAGQQPAAGDLAGAGCSRRWRPSALRSTGRRHGAKCG